MTDLSELQTELLTDLKSELENDDNYSESALTAKIRNAVREAYEIRNYPDTYTDEMVLADMERLYSKIRGRALFDYNQIGFEYESSHSENSITRTYNYSKDKLFPITALCRVI